MSRAAASSCDRADDRAARVPRARVATDHARAVPLVAPSAPVADAAVATVRSRLAAFLHELTTVPGSPQIAVLRDRAEALDQAVAAPHRDRGEIETRWDRLSDALARFCPPGTVGHDAGVAGIAPTLAAVR